MAVRADLMKLGDKPSLGEYLRSIWSRRELALALSSGALRSQNQDTVLGNLWHLLNPLMLVGVYYVVFGLILRTDRGVDNFILFLAVGIFTYYFTQKSVRSGATSIVTNLGLIRSIRFPRAVLPISEVARETLALGPAVGIMLVVAVVTGEPISPAWLLLVPVFALQTLFNAGAALIAARLTDHFRDFQNVLPYFFRIMFYLSGVLYSVDRFVTDPTWRAMFDLNPFFAFVSLARGPLLDQRLDMSLLASALVWTVVLAVVGLLFFRAGEQDYGRG